MATSFGFGPEELFEFVHHQLAGIIHGDDAQARSLFLAENLPGHDIGVVLHGGNDDLVSAADVGSSPGLGHEIDAFGGPANKNDFAGIGGVEKSPHHFASLLVALGGPFGEGVHAAMNIGVLRLVVIHDGIDHGLGLLGSGGVVQVNERLAVNLCRQNREILAQAVDVVAGFPG